MRPISQCVRECSDETDIVSFNDAKDRTKKEILDVVACAIKKAEAK